MNPIDQAISLLQTDHSTFIAVKDGAVYQSKANGISPILEKLEEDLLFFEHASVADKVIGKAAALLLIKGKIKELHAVIISEYAKEILDQYHIPYTYDQSVPYIVNRAKNGMCPMEQAVLTISNPDQAHTILQKKMLDFRSVPIINPASK